MGRTAFDAAQVDANNALLFHEGNRVVVESLKPERGSDLTIELFATPTDTRPTDWRFLGGWAQQARLMTLPNGAFGFAIETKNGNSIYLQGPPPARGERTHLAGVIAGSEIRFFVNGQLSDRKSRPRLQLADVSSLFTLGARSDGRFQFLGAIDEVHVSSVARYRENFVPAARCEPDEHTLSLFHGDETDGERLLDASSHEHHGQLLGATRLLADSLRIETATVPAGLQFDGRDDYVSVPSLTIDDEGPYTLEAWFWQQHQQTQQFVVTAWGTEAGMQFQTNNGIALVDALPVKREAFVMFFKPAWPIQQRLHVACCWQDSRVFVFVNGERQTHAISQYPRDTSKNNVGTMIGARSFGEGKIINSFAGRIDELRLSRAFRYDERFTPPDDFEPDAETLALYHFDEGEGDELRDSSGHEHHGKIVGPKWVSAINKSADNPRTLTPSDSWVNLESSTRLATDAVAGKWRIKDSALESLGEAVQGSPPRLLLPVIPAGGYEFEFTVTRLTGDGAITAHLPAGHGNCVLQLDHAWPGRTERIAGLQFLNGERVFSDQNPTRVPIVFDNNRAYCVTLRVELPDDQTARVQMLLDDKPLVDWTGPQTSLGADSRWRRHPLGIGSSDNATARFDSVRFRVLTGTARLLRDQHSPSETQ